MWWWWFGREVVDGEEKRGNSSPLDGWTVYEPGEIFQALSKLQCDDEGMLKL